MAEILNLSLKGLYTNPNSYSAVPDGSLVMANNVVIDRPGLIDVRRGNKIYSTEITNISKLFKYKNRIIAFYDDTTLAHDDGAGNFVDYTGTFTQPDPNYRMRAIQASSNLYFTTAGGVYKISSLSSTPKISGVSPALDVNASTTGSTGFLDNNHCVAYRTVWGYMDENNNLVLGASSQRVVVCNQSGGTRDVSLTFTIPGDITVNNFYQIYRSYDTTSTSDIPSDELYLVLEGNPTSAEISTGTITVIDNTPFDLMGEALYTNATQQGIAQSNYQPPFCKDMDTYKNHLFFANTKQKQKYITTVIGIGAPIGIQVNDTITVFGITYTAKAAEDIVANEFKVFTTGTLAENIESTAQSLVKVVNRSATSLVYAYYVSGYNELPGKIRFEEKTIGGAVFSVTSSRGTAFTPELPSSGTTESSSADTRENGLYFSKTNQPEHVPLLNYLLVGSADVAIDRIVALRDSLFIFKKDGIFRLSGSDATNFSIDLFDNTTSLIAKESAVAFNNSVTGWFDQGICSVSDGGVAIISEPIAQELLILSSSNYTNFDKCTFGISYETDRRYIVYTNTNTNDTKGTQAFVYNNQTNCWTRWVNNRSCGIVGTDNKLYAGNTIGVYQERKEYTINDYADESYDTSIVSYDEYNVVVADATNIAIGMTLKQGAAYTIITNVSGTTLTVDDLIAWDIDTVSAYTPIDVEIQFNPLHCGDPSRIKHFQEIVYSFNNGFFNTIDGFFTSDFCDVEQHTSIVGNDLSGWGQFPWGTVPWGIDTGKIKNFRDYVPMEVAKAHHLNIGMRLNEAFKNPAWMGTTIYFDTIQSKYQS